MATSTVDFGRYKRLVQYFWDPEPANDGTSDSPVWCLGRQYQIDARAPLKVDQPVMSESTQVDVSSDTNRIEDVGNPISMRRASEQDSGWPRGFLDDFEARFWFTYRSNFPSIPLSNDPKALAAMSLRVRIKSQLVDQGGFTSDTGWGCMIRSGQCLLANAISTLKLGRDWRRGSNGSDERAILAAFADDPRAPFSIHKFVEHGAAACGKHPGEWFGPSATARCIQALMENQEQSDLRVYVNSDGADVDEQLFMDIAKPDRTTFHPTLLLLGTRLGLDKITPAYWDSLKSTLQMPQSIGIAGGRPSSSHYFVGTHGHFMFYLDPHHTRPAFPYADTPESITKAHVDSFHSRRLRHIHLKEMDPSMLIAFLIHDENDWRNWIHVVKDVPGKAIIHVINRDSTQIGTPTERASAIDEVESFDEDEEAS